MDMEYDIKNLLSALKKIGTSEGQFCKLSATRGA